MNKMENKPQEKQINKVKGCFFEKIRKTDKPLTRFFLKKRDKRVKIQIFTLRNKIVISLYPTDIKRKVRQYHKQFHANQFNNLNTMDKFLLKITHNLLKLTGETVNI